MVFKSQIHQNDKEKHYLSKNVNKFDFLLLITGIYIFFFLAIILNSFLQIEF